MPGVLPPLALAALDTTIAAIATVQGHELVAIAAAALTGFWALVGYPSVIRERHAIRRRRLRAWLACDLDDYWLRLEQELHGGG